MHTKPHTIHQRVEMRTRYDIVHLSEDAEPGSERWSWGFWIESCLANSVCPLKTSPPQREEGWFVVGGFQTECKESKECFTSCKRDVAICLTPFLTLAVTFPRYYVVRWVPVCHVPCNLSQGKHPRSCSLVATAGQAPCENASKALFGWHWV